MTELRSVAPPGAPVSAPQRIADWRARKLPSTVCLRSRLTASERDNKWAILSHASIQRSPVDVRLLAAAGESLGEGMQPRHVKIRQSGQHVDHLAIEAEATGTR